MRAARRTLDANNLGYTVALGIPELRGDRLYADRYGIEVGVDDVVTTGSSGGHSASLPVLFRRRRVLASRVILLPQHPLHSAVVVEIECGPRAL